MVLKTVLVRTIKNSGILLTVLSMFAIQGLSAQHHSDSTKKLLLASLDKKAESKFFIQPSNVVFPEILKGNEEEILPYIEKFSTNRRAYLVRMYTKGKNYLPKAAAILKKYDLPEELKVLLTLESAYNGNAVSKAGAVGYWQIMDEVAKEYGINYIAKLSAAEKKKMLKLKTTKAGKNAKKRKPAVKLKDDRKNFNIATHAAARYLRDRRRNLNDNWLLVVASYNCGVGNVWNAMAKTGLSNPTFWDIKNYLPAETRAYVMNFITVNVIFNNYDLFSKDKLKFSSEKVMIPAELEKTITETTPSDY